MINILKKLLILMLTIVITSCGGESGDNTDSVSSNDSVNYTNMSIYDANILLINSTFNISNAIGDIGDIDKIVSKITKENTIKMVKFETENNQIDTIYKPVYIQDINESYLIMAFGVMELYPLYTYIVEKSTGNMFNLNLQIRFPENTMANYKNFKIFNNNLYILSEDINRNTLHKQITKIDISDLNNIKKYILNLGFENIQFFELDNKGNIIYTAKEEGDTSSNIFSKIIMNNGDIYDIEKSYAIWKGLNGKLYSSINNYDILEHNISDDYIYSSSVIETPNCFISWGSSIIFNELNILISEPSYYGLPDDITLCEVYNASMTPRKFSSDMNSINSVEYSSNYYYIAGNDLTNNPVLRKYDPSDDTYMDLLGSGDYDVYKFSVSENDVIKFNALRMSDGKKIIGSISSTGDISILDENSNIEVSAMEKI